MSYVLQESGVDVGEPVEGRYDAIRAAEKSLVTNMWEESEFVEVVKKKLKKKRTARTQVFNGIRKVPSEVTEDTGVE